MVDEKTWYKLEAEKHLIEHRAQLDREEKDRQIHQRKALTGLTVMQRRRTQKTPTEMMRINKHKDEIIYRRKIDQTYQKIADDLGFSMTSLWRWDKKWRKKL